MAPVFMRQGLDIEKWRTRQDSNLWPPPSEPLKTPFAAASLSTPGALVKRLDRIVRTLERLDRNDGVAIETVALFVRYWLTVTPSLPEQTSVAARQKGGDRYEQFVAALGRRLMNGSGLLKEISLDVLAGAPEN